MLQVCFSGKCRQVSVAASSGTTLAALLSDWSRPLHCPEAAGSSYVAIDTDGAQVDPAAMNINLLIARTARPLQ